MLIFGPRAPVITGAVIFALVQTLVSKKIWHRKFLILTFVAVSFLVLMWSQFWAGQVFLILSLASFMILSEHREDRVQASIFFYIFLVFLNFYILQSQTPLSYGLIYLGVLGLIFLAAKNLIDSSFAAIIMTFILAQFIFVMNFLPHGYFALATVSLLATYVLFSVLKDQIKYQSRRYRGAALKLLGFMALIILILITSGIRPR